MIPSFDALIEEIEAQRMPLAAQMMQLQTVIASMDLPSDMRLAMVTAMRSMVNRLIASYALLMSPLVATDESLAALENSLRGDS